MGTTRLVLIFLVLNITLLAGAQEPITDAQRIYEFLNYGPLGLFYGVLPSTIGSLNISERCSISLNHTIDALRNGELWPNQSGYHTNQTPFISRFSHIYSLILKTFS